MDWQPIETAPKDGAWVFLCWPTLPISSAYPVAFWDDDWVFVGNQWVPPPEPTHWMPLPPSPFAAMTGSIVPAPSGNAPTPDETEASQGQQGSGQ